MFILTCHWSFFVSADAFDVQGRLSMTSIYNKTITDPTSWSRDSVRESNFWINQFSQFNLQIRPIFYKTQRFTLQIMYNFRETQIQSQDIQTIQKFTTVKKTKLPTRFIRSENSDSKSTRSRFIRSYDTRGRSE